MSKVQHVTGGGGGGGGRGAAGRRGRKKGKGQLTMTEVVAVTRERYAWRDAWRRTSEKQGQPSKPPQPSLDRVVEEGGGMAATTAGSVMAPARIQPNSLRLASASAESILPEKQLLTKFRHVYAGRGGWFGYKTTHCGPVAQSQVSNSMRSIDKYRKEIIKKLSKRLEAQQVEEHVPVGAVEEKMPAIIDEDGDEEEEEGEAVLDREVQETVEESGEQEKSTSEHPNKEYSEDTAHSKVDGKHGDGITDGHKGSAKQVNYKESNQRTNTGIVMKQYKRESIELSEQIRTIDKGDKSKAIVGQTFSNVDSRPADRALITQLENKPSLADSPSNVPCSAKLVAAATATDCSSSKPVTSTEGILVQIYKPKAGGGAVRTIKTVRSCPSRLHEYVKEQLLAEQARPPTRAQSGRTLFSRMSEEARCAITETRKEQGLPVEEQQEGDNQDNQWSDSQSVGSCSTDNMHSPREISSPVIEPEMDKLPRQTQSMDTFAYTPSQLENGARTRSKQLQATAVHVVHKQSEVPKRKGRVRIRNAFTTPRSTVNMDNSQNTSHVEHYEILATNQRRNSKVNRRHKLPDLATRAEEHVQPSRYQVIPLTTREGTFEITPPGFDVRYRDMKNELRTVDETPEEVKLKAVEKCSEWLTKYMR